MKPMYRILLLLFLIPLTVGATNIDPKGKHTKSKVINKEFNVNSDATVAVKNKYGNIDVVTWDENRVVMEITITTNGDDLEKVEKRLEQIDVVFEGSSNRVSAKTLIEKNKSNWSFWGKKNRVNMEINYKVKMPRSNHADLNMDYGGISLDQLDGNATIDCDYGHLSIGDLRGAENKINIDYTKKSTVDFAATLDLNADYSTIHIDKAGNTTLNADYSHVSFGTVADIDYNCDYGDLKVAQAQGVNGKSDYMTAIIENLDGKGAFDMDYGSLKINALGEGFSTLDIKSSYVRNKIGVGATAFDITANVSYAGFKVPEGFTFNREIKSGSKKEYGGYYQAASSGRSIVIKASYGSVTFNK